MKDQEPLKRFDAGQPIRFEPMDKGHFTPLDTDHWIKKFYILPKDLGGSSHLGCCDLKTN